jgi:hypothetical protein
MSDDKSPENTADLAAAIAGDDHDGKRYDAGAINARLRLESEVESADPTRPGHLKHLIAATVVGSAMMQARQRRPDRAFVHVVTWSEYRPHLHELAPAGVSRGTIERLSLIDEVDPTDGSRFDASWEEPFQDDDVNATHAAIVQRILVARVKDAKDAVELKRGDAIRLQFVGYRCYGTFFWNGEAVVPPFSEESDYYALPPEFKVPDFPLDYWDDVNFVEYSHCGPFCFDTSLLPSAADTLLTSLTGNRYCAGRYLPLSVDGRPWHLILLCERDGDDDDDDDDSDGSSDDEATVRKRSSGRTMNTPALSETQLARRVARENVAFARLLDKFRVGGRCFGLAKLDDFFSDRELQAELATVAAVGVNASNSLVLAC